MSFRRALRTESAKAFDDAPPGAAGGCSGRFFEAEHAELTAWRPGQPLRFSVAPLSSGLSGADVGDHTPGLVAGGGEC